MTRRVNPMVGVWLEKGDHDLGSAKIIYQYIPDYFDTVAFHCQQAVEKYIKSLLVLHKISFPRSHDLSFLLDLLSLKRKVDKGEYDKAIVLNNFSIEIRYPEKIIHLTNEELVEAIAIAEYFREYALQIINSESIQ